MVVDVLYSQAVLDVLVPLVRGCKVGGLPETFVSEVFPCVVQRVLDSDDSSLLQVRRRRRGGGEEERKGGGEGGGEEERKGGGEGGGEEGREEGRRSRVSRREGKNWERERWGEEGRIGVVGEERGGGHGSCVFSQCRMEESVLEHLSRLAWSSLLDGECHRLEFAGRSLSHLSLPPPSPQGGLIWTQRSAVRG